MKEIIVKNKCDQWVLEEKGYKKSSGKYYEGLFTQGNGYMDARASLDEGIVDVNQGEEYERKPANVTLEKGKKVESKWGTYVPGIVGRHPNLFTEIINLPYFWEMVLFADDERLNINECNILNHKRSLNMQDGSLCREFIWKAKSGLALKVEYIRFMSFVNRHTAISQVVIEAVEGEGELAFAAGINAGVRTNGFNHFESVNVEKQSEDEVSIIVKTNGKNEVAITSKILTSSDFVLSNVCEKDRASSIGRVHIKKGQRCIIQKINAVVTDNDLDKDERSLVDRNQEYINQIVQTGVNEVYEMHKSLWAKKWENADIIIKGDDLAQKALRMSIYHLLRSNNDEDDRVAICAKGYAGEAYFGRYFWDTEINMLPFYIYTNPEAAKKLLLFRYNTLEGAKRNAKKYGYAGARYPWESSVSGDEECANWQYCDHEVHVTADIIYAIEHYVRATNDEDFVKGKAIDIMVETSRYWCERVDRNKDGSYSLLGVMGPDEYLPITSNNRFTNKMVKFALGKTVEYLEKYKEESLDEYKMICERLKLTDEEIISFEKVEKNLKLDLGSSEGVIDQCDEFQTYADIDFDEIWPDRSRCFGEFISQERNYRSKALKQADVLEMLLLFKNEFSKEQIKANYEYYEPITTHDSSLSAAVHGILAAFLGKEDEAKRFLDKVIQIDLSEEKHGAEEGIHIANCGGLWQLVVFGFAGLESAMSSGEIKFSPKLPKGWESISIPLTFRGETKRYTVTN